MSDPNPRRPDSIPAVVWGMLGFLVVLAFVLALGGHATF
jgi:hypothetical protein